MPGMTDRPKWCFYNINELSDGGKALEFNIPHVEINELVKAGLVLSTNPGTHPNEARAIT
jgi:hypothetical protein